MKTSGGRRAGSRALAVTATAATAVLLTAPVAGVVERLAVGSPQQVDAGDLLVVIRPAQ